MDKRKAESSAHNEKKTDSSSVKTERIDYSPSKRVRVDGSPNSIKVAANYIASAIEVKVEKPEQEDCCIVCMEGSNEKKILPVHLCNQCSKSSWHICECCNEALLSRTCPVCRGEYAPVVLHSVPGPAIRLIGDPRLSIEEKTMLLYKFGIIRHLIGKSNVVVWNSNPGKERLFLALPKEFTDGSGNDPAVEQAVRVSTPGSGGGGLCLTVSIPMRDVGAFIRRADEDTAGGAAAVAIPNRATEMDAQPTTANLSACENLQFLFSNRVWDEIERELEAREEVDEEEEEEVGEPAAGAGQMGAVSSSTIASAYTRVVEPDSLDESDSNIVAATALTSMSVLNPAFIRSSFPTASSSVSVVAAVSPAAGTAVSNRADGATTSAASSARTAPAAAPLAPPAVAASLASAGRAAEVLRAAAEGSAVANEEVRTCREAVDWLLSKTKESGTVIFTQMSADDWRVFLDPKESMEALGAIRDSLMEPVVVAEPAPVDAHSAAR